MARPKKSKGNYALTNELAEAKAELKFIKQSRNVFAVISVLKDVIRYSALVALIYIFYLCVYALAGKTTLADIGINILANVQISNAVAWLFGGGGILYGYRQKRVRQRAIEHIQTRNIELERRLDPKRTSSLLTPRGDTNPQDDI